MSEADAMQLVRQLAARVQYLEDVLEIQKVQSRYAHLLFKREFERIVDECFAKKVPDVTLEFSDSGVYRGLESIRRVYSDFARIKEVPGFFVLHMTLNPYIEIAKDGMTARSHWLSPGAVGSSSSASWVWGPYYVDYAREDGRWLITHSKLVPLFRNPYEESWAKATDHGTVRRFLSGPPDEPSTLYRPYNEAKLQPDLFLNHPKLPVPY